MNRQVHLVRYPVGAPRAEDFAIADAPMPTPRDGEVLLRVDCLGLDPFPRLRMRADSRVGPPLPLNQVVDGRGIATVIASRHADFGTGDVVAADTGWQHFTVLPGDRLQRLDLALGPRREHLSLLGPSGLTALFVTERAARPGEMLAMAPAAGSVGILAGQIARLLGAHSLGIGASTAQTAALPDLGYDEAISVDDVLEGKIGCEINAFIDGVGGALHDAVLLRLAPHARIVLLGFIAGYNDAGPPRYGNMLPLLMKRATLTGFLLADHEPRFAEARRRLAAWRDAGQLRAVEAVHDGLAATPAAFAGLFGDAPPGKQIVRLTEEA